jgi:hypothetical protein
MAQGRSTEIITMIKWIQTSRLLIKELSLSDVTILENGKQVVPVKYTYTTFKDIKPLAPKSSVNVIAVVNKVEAITTFPKVI